MDEYGTMVDKNERLGILMSIVNVVISVALSKKYGAIGAAMGTTIAIIMLTERPSVINKPLKSEL